MWFGTRDGLNRFDGYIFKTFRNSLNDSLTLGNNSVLSLLAIGNDNLLAGTENGLYTYDPVKDRFSLVPTTEGYFVRSLCEDKQGNTWAMLNHCLFRYNPATGKSHLYSEDQVRVESLCTDEEGHVWISSGGLLYQYNFSSDNLSIFNYAITGNGAQPVITRVFSVGNGVLLAGTLDQRLVSLDTKKHLSKDILSNNPDLKHIIPNDITRYTENEYWVATEYGLVIVNINESKITKLHMEQGNKYSLSDNVVNTLCRDNEGGVWAGTRFGGINYYPFPYNFFRKYFSQSGMSSIQGNGIHEIYPDGNGNLWIGTETSGLNKLNLENHEFTQYSLDFKNETFPYPNIHGLLKLGNELWIGTFQYGLFKMDLKSGKVIAHYSASTNTFKSNFIVQLFRTRSGRIFAGTWEGLYEYVKLNDSFVPIQGFEIQTQSMMEDRRGNIWITTLGNGVFVINEKTSKIKNYRASLHQDSLPSNMVNGQYEDSSGQIWFATDNGLVKFEPLFNRFKTYRTAQGLPSDFVFKILEDKSGNLWVSTTKGLIRFNPKNEAVKVFTITDGLLNDQFNWNSAYKDSTGRMYFGSVKGMISFIPESFTINTRTPPVYITGIQVFNQEIGTGTPNSPLTKSVTYTEKIKLKYNQSTISIDFAALSYTAPEMNEYAYMMEGLDNRWIKLKSNQKANFTQLPPGHYTFRVRASNSSGIWNEDETKLYIVIEPPFWKTWWAFICYALMIIGISWFGFRIYHNFMQEKHRRNLMLLEHQKEKELYENKIEFFTAIAHEIRTPLTLIQGPMENIMPLADKVPEISKNLRMMEKNTARLLEISQQLLDFRKLESKHFKLKLEEVNISKVVQDVHQNFAPLMEQRNIKSSLQINPKSIFASVDLDSFEKIINNLYSNAVKYSETFIKTSLSWLKTEDLIEVEITTDGPAIPTEIHDKIFEPFFRIKETNHQPGTGIGLAISRSLAELHNGTLGIKISNNHLNSFVLKLPAHTPK